MKSPKSVLQHFVTRFDNGEARQTGHEHDGSGEETGRQNGALEHGVVHEEPRESRAPTQRIDEAPAGCPAQRESWRITHSSCSACTSG